MEYISMKSNTVVIFSWVQSVSENVKTVSL